MDIYLIKEKKNLLQNNKDLDNKIIEINDSKIYGGVQLIHKESDVNMFNTLGF